MVNNNEKAARDATQTASKKNGVIADGEINAFSVVDYDNKMPDLQEQLFGLLADQRPRVHRCFRCQNCDRPRTLRKMSKMVGLCRDCISAAREKGKIARSNFINRAVNNFLKNLVREVENA